MAAFDSSQPHDRLARRILSEPDLAADLLRNYLDPGIVGLLDLDRLQYEPPDTIDAGLDASVGDLRFSAPFKDGGRRSEVFVFIEHQSSQDRFISLRF